MKGKGPKLHQEVYVEYLVKVLPWKGGQALEQAHQERNGITIPGGGGVAPGYKVSVGFGSPGLVVRINDPNGFFLT